MKDCNVEGVYHFPGMIVFDGDVPQWTGVDEAGLDAYIEKYRNRDKGLMGYKIYKAGEFVETIGDYVSRK